MVWVAVNKDGVNKDGLRAMEDYLGFRIEM